MPVENRPPNLAPIVKKFYLQSFLVDLSGGNRLVMVEIGGGWLTFYFVMDNAVDILLVEDNEDDAELTIRALKKSNLANQLLHLENGQKALDFLFDEKNGMPRLILLDLKMPKVDGIEVLRKLKSDEKRKVIPVVVLTSSKEESDIVKTYELGANAYIVKPVDFEQFVKAVTQLGFFWLLLNQPPIQSTRYT